MAVGFVLATTSRGLLASSFQVNARAVGFVLLKAKGDPRRNLGKLGTPAKCGIPCRGSGTLIRTPGAARLRWSHGTQKTSGEPSSIVRPVGWASGSETHRGLDGAATGGFRTRSPTLQKPLCNPPGADPCCFDCARLEWCGIVPRTAASSRSDSDCSSRESAQDTPRSSGAGPIHRPSGRCLDPPAPGRPLQGEC
jgi:hypothetical protein